MVALESGLSLPTGSPRMSGKPAELSSPVGSPRMSRRGAVVKMDADPLKRTRLSRQVTGLHRAQNRFLANSKEQQDKARQMLNQRRMILVDDARAEATRFQKSSAIASHSRLTPTAPADIRRSAYRLLEHWIKDLRHDLSP